MEGRSGATLGHGGSLSGKRWQRRSDALGETIRGRAAASRSGRWWWAVGVGAVSLAAASSSLVWRHSVTGQQSSAVAAEPEAEAEICDCGPLWRCMQAHPGATRTVCTELEQSLRACMAARRARLQTR
ncbi:hypothetical protein CDCA_CDCA17G4462 [Cyanidium caldarium]|uniref:Uncharacterized protein n=1 Tax=Cyanidium caldarium TaxID=2771 RepID=A0AAV9J1F7_CYACA|nr:hypothetical protein CDCA_CDCA17G4462 [Cyanidium caldarium]